MSSRSGVALCIILLALTLAAGTAVAHQSTGHPAAGDTAPSVDRQETVTPNETVPPPEQIFHVELQRNGDARWRVAVEFTLRSDDHTAAFEELAARFREGDSRYVSVEWFRVAAARASDATGRSMTLQNVGRSAGIENGTGRLVLSFTWTNFAQQDDESLAVGDAFNTTDDGWLTHLTADQTLYIEPPEEYGIRSRSGTPPVGVEDGTARWTGPVSFSSDGINLVYAGNVQTTTTASTTTTALTPSPSSPTSTQPPTTGPGTDDGLAILPVVGFIVLVATLVTAVALRRGPDEPGDESGVTSGGDGSGGTQAATATDGASDAADTVDRSAEPAPDESTPGADAADGTTGASGAAAAGAGADEDGEGDEDDDIAEELLSDEERVERLIERNGGRMKQANIVSETGWSNAKVSQLLSSMDEAGRIDKLRIGRENLISFPDEDVGDFDSEES